MIGHCRISKVSLLPQDLRNIEDRLSLAHSALQVVDPQKERHQAAYLAEETQ
jgi:hypothetical protein